jgi:hypothetical protein
MEPLLVETHSDSDGADGESKTSTFPLHIVWDEKKFSLSLFVLMNIFQRIEIIAQSM